MPKQNEIDYLDHLTKEGKIHTGNKPFSDVLCGRHLYEIGVVFQLLPAPPTRLIDLGIGSGWTSSFFAKNGYQVTGQDIAPSMIELAEENKRNWDVTNLELIVQDYEGMKFESEFDAAVFYDSLHHAVDPLLALQKVYQALKPNGTLITVEPGKGHSTSDSSKRAVEEFGVTENDMPPSLIIEFGKKVGFKHFEIFDRHIELPSMYSGNGDDLQLEGRFSTTCQLLGKAFHALLSGPKKSHHKAIGVPSTETFAFPKFVRLSK